MVTLSSMEVLSVSQLSFSYSQHPVLRDIHFSVNKGEYVSIIGPNGSGKSTLLKCLNRLILPHSQTIKVLGRELSTYHQKDLAKIIGYVPQHQGEFLSFSVAEFVLMGRYPYLDPFQSYSKDDYQIVDNILTLTSLNQLKDRYVHQLSGGERQKVFLASALAQQPKILLLDEPTIHLDPHHNIEIQKLIANICKEFQMTILHVTHDLTYLERWSHKLIALQDGKILFCGKPSEILTPLNLEKVFQIPFAFFNDSQSQQKIIVPKV